MEVSKVKPKANVRRVNFSLRYKLLIILTFIPLVALGLYLRLATNLFEKDKEAYVYDSAVAVAKSLAMQMRVELESFLGAVKPIIEGYDGAQNNFTEQSQNMFNQYPRLQALVLYEGNAAGQYKKLGELKSASGMGGKFVVDENHLHKFRQKAIEQGLMVAMNPTSESDIVIASRLGQTTDASHLVFIGLYRAETLLGAFTNSQMYKSFLLDGKGEVNFGPKQLKGTPLDKENLSAFFAPVRDGELPESSFGLKNSRQQATLVSYAVVGIGNMKVTSVVDRKEALKAVDVMVAKSLLFFAALLAATLLISFYASFQLTSTLRDLYDATRKIASGKFDVRIRSQSTDEIGGLADGFNVMAAEVSRLMSETAEKARMENELATVKTVQETLFPPTESKFEKLHVVGHFEPASECGGDWWSYSKVGDKIYLWIGDATGHGAPAALITSAARSASAIIEGLEGMTPGKALEIMNRAIHETSKGKINMTFFLAAVDEKNKTLTYANASHDPPYLIRKPKEGKLTRRHLVPLMEVNGLRLGEKMGSTYQETTVDLEMGDSLVFYTDGVLDLQNDEGVKWGERTFLKALVDATGGEGELPDKMSFLKRAISQYRGNAVLLDDITLFIAQLEEAA